MAGTSRVVRSALSGVISHTRSVESLTNKRAFIPVRHFSVTSGRSMKFVQFSYNDKPAELRVGYLEGDKVVDLNKVDSSLSPTLLGLLKNDQMDQVKKVKSSNPASVPLSSVTLAAPITGMDKVLCVGLNYKDHCEEQNLTPPTVPIIFNKFPSSVVGPNDPVRLRTGTTKKVDFEVELTVVMGKRASAVTADKALDYVFGYTIAQDISARDWQKDRNGGQFLLGKAMDTFCPLGPWVVTGDETGDPQTLGIHCSLNGKRMQSSNTCQLVHTIPSVIERLSSVMTLLPGDIILTGTPGGVGMYRKPPVYLCPGDELVSEIDKLGSLCTKIEQF